MHGHRKQDLMSLAYHREVARLLLQDGRVRRDAMGRLERWEQKGTIHPEYASRWRELLALPEDRLAEHLLRDDDEMQAMRQTSPFAGTLTPQERWALRRSVLSSLEAGPEAADSPGAAS